MPIAGGQLDQRVIVRVPNALANPSRDSKGNLIPTVGKVLYTDVKRWAQIRSYDIESENTVVSNIPSGSLSFVLRRDSFTRVLEVGDKLEYDDAWYAITSKSQNLFNDTMEFNVIPSDSKVRVDFTLTLDAIDTEDNFEVCTEDEQTLEPEANV